MPLKILLIVLCSLLLGFVESYSLTSKNIVLEGPGLKPDKIVLPVRYFFISSDIKEPVDENLLNVSINGFASDKRQCRIWPQILNRKDGSFIVRYKLHEACYDLKISVEYGDKHVEKSPYIFKGPILTEECYCPENIEKWLKGFECKEPHKQIQEDLSRFSSVNFNQFLDKTIQRFNNSMSASVCHYVIKSNKVYRSCYGQHVDFKMFMDATLLSLTRKMVLPDLEFFSNLGDWPLVKKGDMNIFPMFSWCGSKDTWDIVMPTYDLTESTLECMGRVSLDMLSVQGNIEKTWEEKETKAFWRGRDSSRERLTLIDIARKHPDLVNASLTNFFFFRNEEKKYGPKTSHVSFFHFFNYKYQLNLDGTVAAYRFPYLLVGDSLVFKQDSKYYLHFEKDITPWIHFVPIKPSLENLVELLEWAIENDEKAKEIATAGQKYARENLMPQDIFCYHAHLFYEWSKKLESHVIIRKGMEIVEQKSNKDCGCKQSEKDEL